MEDTYKGRIETRLSEEKFYQLICEKTDSNLLIFLNTVTAFGKGTSTDKCEIKTPEKTLKKKRESIVKIFEKINSSVDTNMSSLRITRSYEKIASIGHDLYIKLTEDESNNTPNAGAKKIFDKLLDNKSKKKLTLQIHASDFSIPFEFLNKEEEFSSESLLGVKYQISKQYFGLDDDKNWFRNNASVKIGYLINNIKIESGGCECSNLHDFYNKTFQKLTNEKKSFIEVLINDPDKEVSLASICEQMKDDDLCFLHLEGHLRFDKDNPDDFAHFDFGNIKIYNDELTKLPSLKNKIIFLNCCKSGVNNIETTSTMAKTFLKKDAFAVISVDVKVPQDFAREFAKKFYTTIFSKNSQLDSALHDSALHFYNEKNNICGFFYSVFGRTIIN